MGGPTYCKQPCQWERRRCTFEPAQGHTLLFGWGKTSHYEYMYMAGHKQKKKRREIKEQTTRTIKRDIIRQSLGKRDSHENEIKKKKKNAYRPSSTISWATQV